MSNTTPTGSSSSQQPFRTAREAVGSAAEQVKAAAPSAYDAGAKAVQNVGSTASEYPLTTLLVTAGLAYLAGLLSNSSSGGRQNWQDSADAIRKQVRSTTPRMPEAARYVGDQVAQSAKSAGDYVRQGSSSASDYVTRGANSAGDYVTYVLNLVRARMFRVMSF